MAAMLYSSSVFSFVDISVIKGGQAAFSRFQRDVGQYYRASTQKSTNNAFFCYLPIDSGVIHGELSPRIGSNCTILNYKLI